MKNKNGTNGIFRWLVIQIIMVMIASVCIYASIDFYDNYILLGNKHYEAIRAIGMFFPMGLVMGAVTYLTTQRAYRYVSRLVKGIEKVARGDFSVQLDSKKAGPLSDVFVNFNKMVTELQSVQTLRNDFINSFSHEFKTPITSINGFAALLLEENISEEDRRQYLQIIADESERLATLSNNSLLLSKLESQQLIDKQPYPLDEQIKRCAILLSNEWSKKRIEVTAELEQILYSGNYDLMQHVWINLLTNAIKFTPEHGEIALLLKKESGSIKFTISDTGKGMSEEETARIFVKYYQGDSSHATKGLGLGLSITRRIIDLCGGTIKVSSRIDEGSTFDIYLPIE